MFARSWGWQTIGFIGWSVGPRCLLPDSCARSRTPLEIQDRGYSMFATSWGWQTIGFIGWSVGQCHFITWLLQFAQNFMETCSMVREGGAVKHTKPMLVRWFVRPMDHPSVQASTLALGLRPFYKNGPVLILIEDSWYSSTKIAAIVWNSLVLHLT